MIDRPGHQKARPGLEPAVDPRCPEPPPFLGPYAQDEWWTVAVELHKLGLLTRLDVPSLAAYCMAYARWREAEEALAMMADRDEHTRGLLVTTSEGNVRSNPLVKIATDAAEDMPRFAGEFGLTPVARTRLAAGG
jgi:P27 family predicted phage terminase small subunit